jgi:hypothetical protein
MDSGEGGGGGDGHCYDWVKIYTGCEKRVPYDDAVEFYCGTDIKNGDYFESLDGCLTIVFESDEMVQAPGFTFEVEVEELPPKCDEEDVHELTATSTPQLFNDKLTDTADHPDQNYYSNLDCRWEIQGTDASKQVHVEITHFDLESDGTGWCNDMVTIEAGCGGDKEILAEEICGTLPHIKGNKTYFKSFDQCVQVSFMSDFSTEKTGLTVKYWEEDIPADEVRELPKCELHTTLTPESHPLELTDGSAKTEKFAPRSTCQWTIEDATEGTYLYFDLTRLDFPLYEPPRGSPQCRDTLTMWDDCSNPVPSRVLCGRQAPSNLFSTQSGCMRIQLDSNGDDVVGTGFSAKYWKLSQEDIAKQSCRPLATIESGPERDTLSSRHQDFRGHEYSPGINCEWIIQSAPNKEGVRLPVRLEVISLDVEMSEGCTRDSLTIVGGCTGDAVTPLGRYCGGVAPLGPPGGFFSASGCIRVTLSADAVGSGHGFGIRHWSLSNSEAEQIAQMARGDNRQCSGTKLIELTGDGELTEISDGSSINFYQPGLSCEWIIQATEPNHLVHLKFLTFNVEGNPNNCKDDMVTVIDKCHGNNDTSAYDQCGNPVGEGYVLCGREPPGMEKTYTGAGGCLRVIFKSDWFDNEDGWHAEVWAETPPTPVFVTSSMEVQSAGLDANRFMFDATLRRAYRATVAKTMTEQMQAKASGDLSANVVRENDVQITSAVDVTGSRRARSLAGGNAQHVDVGYSVRFSSAFVKDLPSQEEAAGYVDSLKDDPTEFLDTYNGVVEGAGLGQSLKMESAAVTQSAKTVTTAGEVAGAACGASGVTSKGPSPSASDSAADASVTPPPTDDTGGLPIWAWISIGVAGGLVVGLLLGGFVASRVVSNRSNKKKNMAEGGDEAVDKSRMTFGIPGNNDTPVGAMMDNPLTQPGGAGSPALQPLPEHMPGYNAQKTTEKKKLKRKTKRVSHSRGVSIIPADAEVAMDETSYRRYSIDLVNDTTEWIDEEDYEAMPGCTIHLDAASMRRFSYNETTNETAWID